MTLDAVNTKQLLDSKTVRGALAAILVLILSRVFGFAFDDADVAQIADIIGDLIAACCALYAIWGRKVAKVQIESDK